MSDRLRGRKPKSAKITLPGWNAPTPERAAKAAGVIVEEVRTPEGAETCDRHHRIQGTLDRLHARHAITDGELAAAHAYQRAASMDEADLGRVTAVRYGEYIGRGRGAVTPTEWIVMMRDKVAEVRTRMPPHLGPALAWIERAAWEDAVLDDLARNYFPGMSRDRGASQSLSLLRSCLAIVCAVFGYPHPWNGGARR